jgi:hypothetical protein
MDGQEFVTILAVDAIEREVGEFDDEMDAEGCLMANVNHRRYRQKHDTGRYIVFETQFMPVTA